MNVLLLCVLVFIHGVTNNKILEMLIKSILILFACPLVLICVIHKDYTLAIVHI